MSILGQRLRQLRRVPSPDPVVPPPSPRTRSELLLGPLTQAMRLIEIGPSHQPLAAKSAGWNTTVVDHASRADLVAKYADHPITHANIEEVDIVWSGGDLAARFPPEAHGTYDAILASHVLEHMPDPLGFLAAAQTLLKPGGLVILALPDKRYTFDVFKPLTSTADWLLAQDLGAHTHSKRAAFNHVAYSARNAGQISWNTTTRLDSLSLAHTLQEAIGHFDVNSETGQGSGYIDYHAWHFTPSSFALLILESALLRDIDFHIADITPTPAHEFHAILARGPLPGIPDTQAQRLALLKATLHELAQGAALLA